MSFQNNVMIFTKNDVEINEKLLGRKLFSFDNFVKDSLQSEGAKHRRLHKRQIHDIKCR
jgi:hypothetical protein